MTRDELTDRVLELFPPLANVTPWEWDETEEGEPVVMVEANATFTGLEDGSVDFTGPIPNTTLIGIYRIKPDGHFTLLATRDDPIVTAAAVQARHN
jgi:hypothetical protein